MSQNIVTPEGRASYPNLVTPRAQKNDNGSAGVPKYSIALLFLPGEIGKFVKEKVDLKVLQTAAMECALEKFGETRLAALRKNDKFRSPFRRDGELKGYAPGVIFINVSSTTKPVVVDAANRVLTDAEVTDRVYAGCRVRAQIKAYAYDKQGNTGVAFGLNNLQFLGDDERIDGRESATKAFGDAVAVDVADMPDAEETIAPKAPAAKAKSVEDLF